MASGDQINKCGVCGSVYYVVNGHQCTIQVKYSEIPILYAKIKELEDENECLRADLKETEKELENAYEEIKDMFKERCLS